MKSRLAVISTKNPTSVLLHTVTQLNLYYPEFDIVIIDSDSTETKGFAYIPESCTIERCCNKNWELGAWDYAFRKYPNYEVYMFLQDTLIPTRRIPELNIGTYDPGTIFTFNYNCFLSQGGYYDDLVRVYKDTECHFISQIPPTASITGGAHSFFITDRAHVPRILLLERPYATKGLTKSKIDSWLSERTVGIIASTFKRRIDAQHSFHKIHGGRLK